MQHIFSRNKDIDKIAFLNWRIFPDEQILNLLNLAEGFTLSAIELAEICLADNNDKKADILVFPILTNVNHGIELYLKAIIWTLNKIMGLPERTEKTHDIKLLFEKIESKIAIYGGQISLESYQEEMLELREYITEIYKKIDASKGNSKMDFSRYPFNNKYEKHFYAEAIGNIEIDLENFVQRLSIIKQKLESFSDFLFYHELNEDW